LPGLICDRLFSVFDVNKNDYLDLSEFTEGMTTLFSEGFLNLAKFIFDFYDFDKNGKISREDVRVVLSYIPLKSDKYSQLKLKYEQEEFKDRVESQDELHILLEKSFKKNDTLDFKLFQDVIQNVSSEIFLYILIFIMDKSPFSKKTLNEFKAKPKTSGLLGVGINVAKTPETTAKMLIASPSLQSKFSSSVTISKSPAMNKRNVMPIPGAGATYESKSMLLKLAGKNSTTTTLPNSANTSGNILLKYSGKNTTSDTSATPKGDESKNVPLQRKQRNNLKDMESSKDFKKISGEYDNLPITSAVKLTKKADTIE
jgi:hypothetical protein